MSGIYISYKSDEIKISDSDMCVDVHLTALCLDDIVEDLRQHYEDVAVVEIKISIR